MGSEYIKPSGASLQVDTRSHENGSCDTRVRRLSVSV